MEHNKFIDGRPNPEYYRAKGTDAGRAMGAFLDAYGRFCGHPLDDWALESEIAKRFGGEPGRIDVAGPTAAPQLRPAYLFPDGSHWVSDGAKE